MMIKMVCPHCNATLSGDENSEVFVCPYCDSKVANFSQKMKVEQHIVIEHKYEQTPENQPQTKTEEKPKSKKRSDGATLVIDYESINPGVNLVTRLANTRQREILTSGQSRKYNLPPGTYSIVLKIGKINHNRTFTIPKDKEPVYIHASWTGSHNIEIEQPEIDEPLQSQVQINNPPPVQQRVQQPVQQPKPVTPPKPKKPWEERSYFERVFCIESIAPWTITAVLLFLMLCALFVSPVAGVLFMLAAIVVCPLVNEFVAMKFFGLIYHKPSKIGCYLLGAILTIVAIFISGSTLAKYALKLMENYPTTPTTTQTSTVIPSLNSKPQKDGFDETTEITVGNYVFKIPTYWQATVNEKNLYKAYAENKLGAEAILEIKAILDVEDPVSYDILKSETEEGLMMKSMKSNFSLPSNEKTEAFENEAIKGFIYSLDYSNYGQGGSARLLCFPSEEDSKWIYVTLTQSENTEYLYDGDYLKILNSISEVEKKQTAEEY